MKTTLDIDDSIMAVLKHDAARRGCTMSEFVESALHLLFKSKKRGRDLAPLRAFESGGHLVAIVDRDSLHQAMEGR